MTTLCLHTHYDKPDDPQPMVCTRQAGHEGDHRPAGHGGDVWATWANENEGAA